MPFPSQSFQFPAGDESRLTRTGLDVICVNFINHRTDRIACFVIYRLETGECDNTMSCQHQGWQWNFDQDLLVWTQKIPLSCLLFSSEYNFCCWD